MTRAGRSGRSVLLALVPAVLLAADVGLPGDYSIGVRIGDTPAPAIRALLHGHLAGAAAVQPVMGLTSILVRAPAVALAWLLGGGTLLQYRLGLVVCAWVAGIVGVVIVQLACERGRSRVSAVAMMTLMVVSPLTLGTKLDGHPEEILGGALCLAAVLAAAGEHTVLTGILLGLALGTKEWALIAVVPAVLALRRERVRMLVTAAVVALPLVLTLPLLDPHAFHYAYNVIGRIRVVNAGSWWWRLSAIRYEDTIGGAHTLGLHLLPFGLTRTQVSWLAPGVSLPLGWRYWRVQHARDPVDAVGLLALLMLMRCTLDPQFTPYYAVPCVIALLAWECVTGRGLPLGSLLAMGLWWLGEHAATLSYANLCDLVCTVGLSVYLVARMMTSARPRWSIRAARRVRMLPTS